MAILQESPAVCRHFWLIYPDLRSPMIGYIWMKKPWDPE
jgi:hypothetical protein